MAQLHESKLCLRISGDSLIPEEITLLLGAAPTFSHAKGEHVTGSKSGGERIAHFGMWLLSVNDRSPETLDDQVRELFEQLTDDLGIWRRIAEEYSADLFCGLIMQGSNEGFTISAGIIKMIADRSLEIGFDLYN